MAVSISSFCLKLIHWVDEAVRRFPYAVLLAFAGIPPYGLDESMDELLDEPYVFMLWMSDW
jgi:hypothetical protein